METLAEKIERYRKMNETIGDPDAPTAQDSDSLFYEITASHDPAIISPLLLMRPYVDECEYSDEMQQILEEFETYPRDVFYGEFITTARRLHDTSPLLLRAILRQITRWEDDAKAFSAQVQRLVAAERDSLINIINEQPDTDGLTEEDRRRILRLLK